MARLAAEQVDIIVSFGHVQNKFADQWQSDFGGEHSVWEDTNVIGVTEGIYNDTVSVSKASEIMTDDFREALAEALIEIGNTDEGKAVIATFSHKGYVKANPEDYDGERDAQALLKELQ
jgi:phosphonate transport system substrate-binding protein